MEDFPGLANYIMEQGPWAVIFAFVAYFWIKDRTSLDKERSESRAELVSLLTNSITAQKEGNAIQAQLANTIKDLTFEVRRGAGE